MRTLEQKTLSLSLKNILLATDFSSGSDVALKHALALASRQSAHVHTLHVAAPDCYQLLDPEAFALTFNGWAANSANPTEVLRGLMQGLPSEVPLHPGLVWQGTLALMVMKTLDVLGPLHGYGIARRIEQTSGDQLQVNYGTLYPALVKLEQEGKISAEWGVSENNRKAKYYRLTLAGQKELRKAEESFEQLVQGIRAILRYA